MATYEREPAAQYLTRIIGPLRLGGKFRGWTLLEIGKHLARLFEGPLRGEVPKQTNLKDNSKRFHDPYLTRLANLAWKFLSLAIEIAVLSRLERKRGFTGGARIWKCSTDSMMNS